MTSSQQKVSTSHTEAIPRLQIDRGLQAALTLGGSLTLCLYWQSWQDVAHLWYDIPAAIAMCGFMAQLVCEIRQGFSKSSWIARIVVMLPMSIIPTCRDFFGWPISGHLTDILAVAMIQTTDSRLSISERIAYWSPIPIIVYIRLSFFDKNGHAESLHGIIAAVLILCVYLLLRNKVIKASASPLMSGAGQTEAPENPRRESAVEDRPAGKHGAGRA